MTKCLINDEDAKLIKRMEELQNSMRNIIWELRNRKSHPDENEVMSRIEFADRELAGAIGYFIAESLLYYEERTEHN